MYILYNIYIHMYILYILSQRSYNILKVKIVKKLTARKNHVGC